MTENFLSPENDCGQTMLKLASRGSAILSQLFKASQHVPEVFTYITKNEPAQTLIEDKKI
jgi:WASH complex subunit strumpellin